MLSGVLAMYDDLRRFSAWRDRAGHDQTFIERFNSAGGAPVRCDRGVFDSAAGGMCLMVGVAQLVEHRVVVARVAGSSPVAHPLDEERSRSRAGAFPASAAVDGVEERQFQVHGSGEEVPGGLRGCRAQAVQFAAEEFYEGVEVWVVV